MSAGDNQDKKPASFSLAAINRRSLMRKGLVAVSAFGVLGSVSRLFRSNESLASDAQGVWTIFAFDVPRTEALASVFDFGFGYESVSFLTAALPRLETEWYHRSAKIRAEFYQRGELLQMRKRFNPFKGRVEFLSQWSSPEAFANYCAAIEMRRIHAGLETMKRNPELKYIA